jgi:hypothetical protein
MRRFPWWLLLVLLALLLGLGTGLGYAWVISPFNLTNSSPNLLRDDFKDQFRSVIAASYAATGNLPRAQARLSLLGDEDAVEALNAQAQRVTASGEFNQADQLAALALALENGVGAQSPFVVPSTPTVAVVEAEPSITLFPSPEDLSFAPTETSQVTSTQIFETGPPASTATPRPTRTQPPTQGAPFRLIGQDTVCDPNLPEGLLQIIVFNSSRRQLAGIKIIITWDTGGEEFFTGLKPELGNGYADFLMFQDTSHAVQLALGSEIATNLVPPDCETPGGEGYLGGYRLTFQQP